MMSLNRADDLRRELEDKHGFNAEQANGTMMVVDEMVDHGIDRVLKSIAELDSKIDRTAMSLRTELGQDIESLRSDMDAQFQAIDKHFKLIEYVMPVASAFFTMALLAGLAVIADGVMKYAN